MVVNLFLSVDSYLSLTWHHKLGTSDFQKKQKNDIMAHLFFYYYQSSNKSMKKEINGLLMIQFC